MKGVNKIAFVFIILVVSLVASVWQLLQTEFFAKLVSDRIEKQFLQDNKWRLSFSRLEIDMFPPATILRQATLSDSENKTLDIKADEFGLYFSIWDLFSKELSIEEIKVTGGIANIKIDGKRKKIKRPKDLLSFIYDLYQKDIYAQIPFNIKNIVFDKTDLFVNEYSVYASKFGIRLNRSALSFKGNLYNLRIPSLKRFLSKDTVDEFDFDLTLNRGGIQFRHFAIKDSLTEVRIFGQLKQNEKYIDSNLRYSYSGEIRNVLMRLKQSWLAREFRGEVELSGSVKGNIFDPECSFDAKINNFVSEYAIAEKIEISGGKKQEQIFVDKIKAFSGSGEAFLARKINIYDLKRKLFIDKSVLVTAKKLHTNRALHIINDILYPLKGSLDGNVEISWEDEIKITVAEGSSITNFRLQIDKGDPVLKNEKVFFSDGIFIVREDNSVLIRASLKFGDSDVTFRGTADEKGVDFQGESTRVDFDELGPISGVQIHGHGPGQITVKGPYEDVRFIFDLKHNDVDLFDLKLGQVNTKLEFILETLELKIHDLKGLYGGTSYSGKGSIVFDKLIPIELWIDVPRGAYKDSQEIYKGLLDLLDDYPKTLSFTYKGSYYVKGTILDNEYYVKGSAVAKNAWWLGEEVDRIKGDFRFKDDVLYLENVKMIKKDGRINGSLSYNYQTEALEYDAVFSGIRCKDIYYYKALNFGLDGEMLGKLKGKGDGKVFSSSSIIRIQNSRIGTVPVKNSLITIYNDSTDLFLNGNVVGDLLTFDSFINLDFKDQSRLSHVNLSIRGRDIKTIAGMISPHNVNEKSLYGRMYANLKSRFSLTDINNIDAELNVNDMRIRKDGIDLKLIRDRNQIIIKNGKIQKWDLSLAGGDAFMRSKGEGGFREKVRIINDFQLETAWATLFSERIPSAQGRNRGQLIYIYNGKKFNLHMNVEGRSVGFKIKGLPSQFEDINYKMVLEDDDLIINKVEGRYGGGSIKLDGNVEFAFPFPVLDLGYEVKRSEVKFFEKSTTVASASGNIRGSAFPYIVSGHISLNNTKVYDDISYLYKATGAKTTVSKYLPAHALRNRVVYYNYDLDVILDESAHIRNSMLDFFINGSCHVNGTLDDLKTEGSFLVVPKMSKLNFTGHDFIIDDGRLVLSDKAVPQYSFSGMTTVNEYNVKLDASGMGTPESIAVKLSSEPSLPQQDIVSLLTLGVTSDISQNLENEERQSITSVGIGALLVDQLKINEGLNESLGLQLSVMPEFEQNEDASMLSGRTEGSNVTAGSVKSATKIKIQKKILGVVDVSVSSTVGGSIKQKQEMKVKWDLLENMSLEGVYEIKSPDEEEIDSNESVGADVKLRWSF